MSIPDQRILRRQELDAFITQAFAPELMNPQYLQELTVSTLNYFCRLKGFGLVY